MTFQPLASTSMAHLALLGLFVAQSSGLATPNILGRGDANAIASASSIVLELSNPTFVPYARPNQKIEEFIALGDSYTAGTGCNGVYEVIAGNAARGQRSYPMQMSTDVDSWGYINGGDETLPRFSFHAYTGDTTVELITEQLKQGSYKDDKNLPRNQPFGKPQIAVMTTGGNDALLGRILNACIYRLWNPGNCQEILASLQHDIDSGVLRDKINVALYSAAHAGRNAGGLDRRETFQVFVLSYITFFNDQNTECDDVTWAYWWASEPKLTTSLRQQLNSLTTSVNGEIKKAAQDLERMGVIFVDGLEETYSGHRFCEPGLTNQKMDSFNTWFWSADSNTQTPSEGPGDPNNLYIANDTNPAQVILDFVFPGQDRQVSDASASSPPWEWEGADKYPHWEDLATAMEGSVDANVQLVPFNVLRSFHPKGTAMTAHADILLEAIAVNRDVVAGGAKKGPADSVVNCISGTQHAQFAQASVEGFINDFCDNPFAFDTVLTPYISFTNGSTASGAPKATDDYQRFLLPGTSDYLHLLVRPAQMGCGGMYKFFEGSDHISKMSHCTTRFDAILKGCQADTATTMLGGYLTDGCLVYTITTNPDDPGIAFPDLGEFLCKPTDTDTLTVTDDISRYNGTCTCYYASAPGNTALFNMPASGTCVGVNKDDLVVNEPAS